MPLTTIARESVELEGSDTTDNFLGLRSVVVYHAYVPLEFHYILWSDRAFEHVLQLSKMFFKTVRKYQYITLGFRSFLRVRSISL